MSKTAKGPADRPGEPVDLPFEEALKRLEEIVGAMESDGLPLETMLARYEEGMKLAVVCQARLAAAEVRIQQLEQSSGGDLGLKPMAAERSEPT